MKQTDIVSVRMRVAAESPNPDAPGMGYFPLAAAGVAWSCFGILSYSCHWMFWQGIPARIREAR
jgi:hypothetical protein